MNSLRVSFHFIWSWLFPKWSRRYSPDTWRFPFRWSTSSCTRFSSWPTSATQSSFRYSVPVVSLWWSGRFRLVWGSCTRGPVCRSQTGLVTRSFFLVQQTAVAWNTPRPRCARTRYSSWWSSCIRGWRSSSRKISRREVGRRCRWTRWRVSLRCSWSVISLVRGISLTRSTIRCPRTLILAGCSVSALCTGGAIRWASSCSPMIARIRSTQLQTRLTTLKRVWLTAVVVVSICFLSQLQPLVSQAGVARCTQRCSPRVMGSVLLSRRERRGRMTFGGRRVFVVVTACLEALIRSIALSFLCSYWGSCFKV